MDGHTRSYERQTNWATDNYRRHDIEMMYNVVFIILLPSVTYLNQWAQEPFPTGRSSEY